MKSALAAAVLVGIWLAPTAHADPQDQPFLAYLAANKVAVDTNTAINAAHLACSQLAAGLSEAMVATIVSQQVPKVNGAEHWIVAGAQKTYCPLVFK